MLGGVGEVCGARVGGNGGGGRGELRRAMVAVAGGLGNRERAERVEGRGINRGKVDFEEGADRGDRDPEKFGIPAAVMPCVACGRRKKKTRAPLSASAGMRERCGRPVGRGFGRVRGLDRCGPRRREREMGLGLGTTGFGRFF